MRSSTTSEPDWTGRWTYLQTFGSSAIAAITSVVKSTGYGDVNRIRSMPSIFATARRSTALAAARERHDAERTELVAAALDRDEAGDTVAADRTGEAVVGLGLV